MLTFVHAPKHADTYVHAHTHMHGDISTDQNLN